MELQQKRVPFLEPARSLVRAEAIKRTATAFNRSADWVYRVLRGDLKNNNTSGVKEFFEQEYSSLLEKLKS